MPDYTAQYRQAMADRNPDFARTVLASAVQAARMGIIGSDEISELRSAVEQDPPEATS